MLGWGDTRHPNHGCAGATVETGWKAGWEALRGRNKAETECPWKLSICLASNPQWRWILNTSAHSCSSGLLLFWRHLCTPETCRYEIWFSSFPDRRWHGGGRGHTITNPLQLFPRSRNPEWSQTYCPLLVFYQLDCSSPVPGASHACSQIPGYSHFLKSFVEETSRTSLDHKCPRNLVGS